MIACIEALNYRCLRYIHQELDSFQVLVGPNASGKSTLLDAVAFLGQFLSDGPVKAVRDRAPDVESLFWMRQGDRFEMALELTIPQERRDRLPSNSYERARYEIAVGFNPEREIAILGENLWLKPREPPGHPNDKRRQLRLFPEPMAPPGALVIQEGKHSPRGWRRVVSKRSDAANDYFQAETTGWNNPFRLGPQKPALANLPEDEERFPVATWVKRVLLEGIQALVLNSQSMRRPAPPGSPVEFQHDGSNLPWAIEHFTKTDPEGFERWVDHLRTALPDLQAVDTVERPEDRHRYLRLTYAGGLSVPSWVVSDGTLRLMALTLVAYLPPAERVYLIEEPENGIHPTAVETVFQSLSSAYEAQILCASHSPVVLSLAEPDQLLCFAKTPEGATDIVRGSEHPLLREWKRETDLGTLFASGVLG
ncbi:MAG: ATP-binding protein [Planctomycetota bacterium]